MVNSNMIVNTNDTFIEEEEEFLNTLVQVRQITSLCLIVLILPTNLMVIAGYAGMREVTRKIPNYLLFMQAIVDVTIGGIALLNILPDFYPSLMFNGYYVNAVNILIDYTSLIVLGTFLLTSLERFAAIKLPLWHRCAVTKRKVVHGMLAVWLSSSVPPAIYLSFMDTRTFRHSQQFRMVYRISFTIIQMVTTLCSLTLLIATLKVASKSVRDKIRNADQITKLHLTKKDCRLICLFITMVTVYTVTYLPLMIASLICDYLDLYTCWQTDLVTSELYILGSLSNPILTLVFKTDFRKSLRRMYERRFSAASHQVYSFAKVRRHNVKKEPGSISITNFV